MTEEQFLEAISEDVDGFYRLKNDKDKPTCRWTDGKYKALWEIDKLDMDCSIINKWVSARVVGGSCWDSSNPHQEPGEDKPDFTKLDAVLELVCPTISFLQYKALCQEIIREDSNRECEYYGNSTTYAMEIVKLRDLYDALEKRSLI